MAAIIGIALWALIPGFIAKKKGRNFWGYYFLSFLISPLITMIITACLKDISFGKNTKIDYPGEYTENTYENIRLCKKCGADISDDTEKCHICGETICSDTDDVVVNNQSTIVEPETIQPNLPQEKRKIEYCRKCGFKLIEESEFCSNCGSKIESEDFEK